MVKKKGATAAASSATSATVSKDATGVLKKSAPEAAAATVKDAHVNLTTSTMTKSDEKKARSLRLISNKEEDICLPSSDSRPNPPTGFTVMFVAFLFRVLSLPSHEFL
jgi:hypothetical protein